MRSRLIRVFLVTITEGPAVFLWLYFSEHEHPFWHGILALFIGEVLETTLVGRALDRDAPKLPKSGPGADGKHRRKVAGLITGASVAEVWIWVAWLEAANAFGQLPEGALVLLVLMHVKHHVEVAAVKGIPFKQDFFELGGVLASALEVSGALGCLALLRDGHPVWAAVVLALGFLIEHTVLVDVLQWEAECRDINVPRDNRWRPANRTRALLLWGVSHFPRLWRVVASIGPLQRAANRYAINFLIDQIEPRPNPLSTMADYTSWASLTDRTWSSRHLPPVPDDAKQPATSGDGPPSTDTVAQLFVREEFTECPKSTVLFTCFAQWFTDGFLRTTREVAADGSRDTRRNESTHEIDLAQLYGLNAKMTRQLRTGEGGLLKSQKINGEDYPQYYCDADGAPKREFLDLPLPLHFEGLSVEEKAKLFAMGSDTRNLGFMAFNVLFLREHNRIARLLADEHDWDDDRLFETARNVLTVVLLKVVVEDYINHINPGYLPFHLTPGSFPNEPWQRPNWMAIEFNLLYRWHSLTPSTYKLSAGDLPIKQSLSNPDPLTSAGLGAFMQDVSRQPAGRIGLFNTDPLLVTVAEKPSIKQARNARLASYNDYRRLSCLKPARTFAQINSDPAVQHALANTYATVEDVEFFVGLFAEESGPDDVLPALMLTMVAYDAFSQALTNPLLGPRVFNEATFSPEGMEIIETTGTISDIVNRNCGVRGPFFVSLTRSDYRFGKRAVVTPPPARAAEATPTARSTAGQPDPVAAAANGNGSDHVEPERAKELVGSARGQ